MLRQFDATLEQIRKTGRTGEMRYSEEHVLPLSATEYFRRNCWVGVSQPGPKDAAARYDIGLDRFMWGSDYPHDEGTFPFTREHLRQLFHDTDEREMRPILAGNEAELYDFDLAKLAPLAAKVGPTVAEIHEAAHEAAARPQRGAAEGGRRGLTGGWLQILHPPAVNATCAAFACSSPCCSVPPRVVVRRIRPR